MDILIATGRLAQQTVKDSVGPHAEVLVVDTDVAAFITPRKLLKALEEQEISKKYDLIFIPGLVSGNFSKVEEEIGCPIYLGPKHAYDLGFVIRFAGEFEFSKNIPACELLSSVRRDMALETVAELEASASSLLTINDLKLGPETRMKVMAEVVDATGLDEQMLSERIRTFIEKGADIIDLGASLNATPDDVERAINVARKISSVPISIDTLETPLIKRALEIGVDIVLSLNSSNIDSVGPDVANAGVAAVVIPDSGKGVESLIANIEAAKAVGIKRLIADPVLDPIGHGIAESIVRYYDFYNKYPDIPLFFGVGNVTELIDVDSSGVNSTLCGIGADVGASILFTPEFSDKTQGSIAELNISSSMMLLAKERNSSPKDLGIDLLILKEKRRREAATVPEGSIEAKDSGMWRLDPAGCIKIGVVPDPVGNSGLIVAEHKKASIIGKDAGLILDTLIEMELVSTLGHAGYLGRELEKAELALRLNRSYAQDDDF